MRSVEVIVMACPDGSRPAAHAACRASLEASDVGSDYLWLAQMGRAPAEHWRLVMDRAAYSEADVVLVLEDDAIVGRHLRHNVATWDDLHHPDCGAGWCYNPGGHAVVTGPYLGAPGTLFGTVAVAYRPERLRRILVGALRAQHGAFRRLPWDCSIDWGVQHLGWQSWIHCPSLAEHPIDVPSYVGNPNAGAIARKTRTSGGTFEAEWRRP